MEEKTKKSIFFKILAGLLIIIILFFSKKENQERFIQFLNVDSLVLDEVHVLNSISTDENIDDIAYYDDYIITSQSNRLIKYNMEGQKEWEKEFNFKNLYITFSNTAMYVCDRDLGDIYCLNLEGDTTFRFKAGDKIKSIKESSEYLFIHVEDNGKEGIEILDANGKLIASNFLEENNILNYCFHREKMTYAYSTIKLVDNSIKSEIQVHSLEGEPQWDLQLEDEVIMYLNYVDDKGLVAMSDRGLYYIDKGNIVWRKDISLVKDISIYNESIYIVYDKTYEIISLDGTTKEALSIAEGYENLILSDGYTILYGNQNLMGLRGTKKVFKLESEEPIIKVIQGNRNLIVMYEERVDIVSY